MDALAAYLQIKVAKEDQPKTTFMLQTGSYVFCKTVMGNCRSSATWLKASNEVIEGLDGRSSLSTIYSLEDVTAHSWQRE